MDKIDDRGILFIDLESSPWASLNYGPWWQPITVKLLDFSQILSMSYRWYGDETTYYIGQNTFHKGKKWRLNDKKLMIEISKVLSEATYIVAHNGDKFDKLMINERLSYHRLPALQDSVWLDTKKMSKQTFNLPSNKLDHVTQFYGHGHKLPHKGVDLFIGCMNGDMEDWATNEVYNKTDVDIMYKDFESIIPYYKFPNSFSKITKDSVTCPNVTCGEKMIKSKRRRVVNGFKQQWWCKKCGRYHTPPKLID